MWRDLIKMVYLKTKICINFRLEYLEKKRFVATILVRTNIKQLSDRVCQLVEHRTAVREVAGSNLGRTNTQVFT